MRKIKLSLGLLLICLFTFVLSSIFVYASTQNTGGINDVELYNQTNTYNYILEQGSNTAKYDFNNEARYDLESRNGNLVSANEPAITVFTHGWKGSRKTFLESNPDNANESLVSKFNEAIYDSYIYVAKYKEEQVYLYDLTHNYIQNNDINISDDILVTNISNISKHIVIIFDGYNTYEGNDYIYTQFNYMMSKILCDYKKLNGGILPKVNLVGHSRGGLTNMQYALDHPDIVASLTSFGTPYLGTSTAELFTIYADSLVSDWALENRKNGFINNGMKDLGTYDVYSKYYNRWNDNYDDLYSHINCLALGGVTTIDYLLDFINFWQILANVGITYESLKAAFGPAVDVIITKIGSLVGNVAAGLLTLSVAIELIDDWLMEKLPDYGDFKVELVKDFKTIIVGVVKLIATEVELNIFKSESASWMSDGAVNIESQMASRVIEGTLHEYKGFGRHYEYFNKNDGSTDIVHNREVTNTLLQNHALENMSISLDTWSTSLLDDNTLAIYGYKGECEKTGDGNKLLVLPSSLEHDGKSYTVSKISECAFADDFYGRNITHVIIPNTIKEIEDKAFYNCPSLKEVDLSNATSLIKIGEKAFANNPNLGNVTLPGNLQTIGRKAFANNKSMTSINIPSSVIMIDEGAFAATSISSISNSSSAYSWTNSLLINQNVSDTSRLEAIYANPNATSITFPNNVKSISALAFAGNSNIKSIDLNQVEVIGTDAFMNSSITNIIGDNVNTADVFSFANTPWLEAQDDNFIVLGKTLLKYIISDESIIVEEGIERIASKAFDGCIDLRRVELPSTITSIGREAFINCPSLESIIMKSTVAPTLDGDCFNDSVTIYVGEYYMGSYDESIYFDNISNDVEILTVDIKFYDGTTYVGTRTENFASMLDNVIIPNKDCYDFTFFTDVNGNVYEKNDDIYFTKDFNLYLNYEKSKYQFILDGTGTFVLEYQAKLNIENPTKDGYSFDGWYDAKNDGHLVIDIDGYVVWEEANEVTRLYARFELIDYFITYSYTGDIEGEFVTTFNAEDPISLSDIPTIKRYGYIFDYWKINGSSNEFTSTAKIYKDITITAQWIGTIVSTSTGTITTPYAIVDMRYSSTSSSFNFTISNQVKYITFIGNPYSTYYVKITIDKRNTGLVLGFENFNFKPVTSSGIGYNAITSFYDYDLYVSYKGTCSITGGKGANGSSLTTAKEQARDNNAGLSGNKGQNGYDGGIGIRANRVIFQEYDVYSYIKITGGAGGYGAKGQTGQKGSNGVKNPYGSFMSPKNGDNGARGGDGGAGGNGGNGGYAIYVNQNTNIKTNSLSNYEFIGGAGGSGGMGGTGGDGGAGASDNNSSIWNGVGDAGDGGRGGNGGTGGNGGNGYAATNALYVYGTGGKGGYGGSGGSYGYGGAGGSAGSYGDDGEAGSRGSNGSVGTGGKKGYTGYNQTGSSESVKKYYYLYDFDNFTTIYIN